MKNIKRLISLTLSLVLIFFILPANKAVAEEPHLTFAYSINDDTDTAVATGLNSGLNYESHEGQGWDLLTGAGLKIISDYGDQLTRCYLHHLNPDNNSMQCMLGDMTYDEVMSKWNAYLQSSVVQDNLSNIVGFNLSDDWYYSPGAGKQFFQDMTTSLHTYTPGHKSICIMTANTSYAKSPQSYSHFAAAMNFSPQGCDMVGIYLYPTVNHLPITNFANAVQGLELLGLDPKVTPVLGIAEDYNTTGAAVENEVKYMCDNGAWGIGFWAYNVRYGSTDGSRSADIRGGMSRGIQYCGGLWGNESGGSGDSSSAHPKPQSKGIKIISVDKNTVNLSLPVDDALSMMLSPNSSFANSSWEPYQTTKTYLKKDNQTKIYLKFKSSYNILSDTVTLDIPVSVESVSSYSDGTLLKTSDSFKIYVVIDGKKKWISTPEVFEQLGYKWINVKEVSPSELNTLADFEDNLIREKGDCKVYLVVNGVERHIPNPETFLDYGFSWNDVKDVSRETINKYKGTYLIKGSGKNEVYYLRSDGVRKYIPTTDIFNSYGDNWEDVQIISGYEMSQYPLSSVVKLSDTNDIYLVEGNIKKHISSADIFNKYHFNWNYVMSVNQTEFNWYKDGGELK